MADQPAIHNVYTINEQGYHHPSPSIAHSQDLEKGLDKYSSASVALRNNGTQSPTESNGGGSMVEQLREELARSTARRNNPDQSSGRTNADRTLQEVYEERARLRKEMEMVIEESNRKKMVSTIATNSKVPVMVPANMPPGFAKEVGNPYFVEKLRKDQFYTDSKQPTESNLTPEENYKLKCQLVESSLKKGTNANELVVRLITEKGQQEMNSEGDPNMSLEQEISEKEKTPRQRKLNLEKEDEKWKENEKKFLVEECQHRDNEILQLKKQITFRKQLRDGEESGMESKGKEERERMEEQIGRLENTLAAMIEEMNAIKVASEKDIMRRILSMERFITERTKAHAAVTQRMVAFHESAMQQEVDKAKIAAAEYMTTEREKIANQKSQRIIEEMESTRILGEKQREVYIKEAQEIVRNRVIFELREEFKKSDMHKPIHQKVFSMIKAKLKDSLKETVENNIEQELKFKNFQELSALEDKLKSEFNEKMEALKLKHRNELPMWEEKYRKEYEVERSTRARVNEERYLGLTKEIESLSILLKQKEDFAKQLAEEFNELKRKIDADIEFEYNVTTRLNQDLLSLKKTMEREQGQLDYLEKGSGEEVPKKCNIQIYCDMPKLLTDEDYMTQEILELTQEYNDELITLQRLTDQRNRDIRPGGYIRTPVMMPMMPPPIFPKQNKPFSN